MDGVSCRLTSGRRETLCDGAVFGEEGEEQNRSVMPFDVLGCTCTTMHRVVCLFVGALGIDCCKSVMNVEFQVMAAH